MFRDALTKLNASQAHTTNSTTVSTSSYDTGNVTPKNKVGSGEPLSLVVTVESVSGSADTFTIELISSTAADLGSSVNGHGRTRVLTAAEIPAGTKIIIDVPQQAIAQGRYLGYRATLGASDALTATGEIVPRSFVEAQEYYATGIVIN
jgi:hypothetical protein